MADDPKALNRCILELRQMIQEAEYLDFDEIAVQSLETAIESMQMRMEATPPQPVTPAGGEVPAWHAFPDELSSSDTVTMYRAPCESMCLLTGRTQSTVPVITHPPVADAALDDARFEWLGQQMRSCTTYMDGSRAFDAGSFAMRKHNLRGRTIREAIDAAMSEDAALNQRGGGDHG